MFDLVGEVAKGAHRDRLLGRVLRVTVALRLVRDDHLSVGLGAESTGLEERLLVPDALHVDVEAGRDVVDGIDNEVEALPEIIVEEILGVGGDEGLVHVHLKVRVHLLGDAAGSLRLSLANVGLAEEELTVQV